MCGLEQHLWRTPRGLLFHPNPAEGVQDKYFGLHWRSNKGVGRPRTHRANGQIRVRRPSPILFLTLILIGQGCWREVTGHAGDFAIFSVSLELVRVMVDAHLARTGGGGISKRKGDSCFGDQYHQEP